jgi:DNA-binding CsgD family transcriptional regulator
MRIPGARASLYWLRKTTQQYKGSNQAARKVVDFMVDLSASHRLDDLDIVTMSYEAAVDPTVFPSVLRGLAGIVGAEAAVWLGAKGAENTTTEFHYVGIDEKGMGDYARIRWASPLAPALIQIGPCVPVPDRTLVPRPVLERSRLYQEWIQPNGLADGMMCTLAPLERDTVTLTLIRERGVVARPFMENADTRRYGRLLPHLQRATSLRRRLATAAPLPAGPTITALDALTIAAFCIDEEGNLLWANAAAERLIEDADGLTYSRNPGFTTATVASTVALRRLFWMSALGIGGALRLDRPSGAEALSLITIPHQQEPNSLDKVFMLPRRRLSLVFVNDPEDNLASRSLDPGSVLVGRLQSLYQLTRAEALVAILITQGIGLPAIARKLGLSHSTIRTHTKRVFAKLDVHSQAQLVRIISGLGLIA